MLKVRLNPTGGLGCELSGCPPGVPSCGETPPELAAETASVLGCGAVCHFSRPESLKPLSRKNRFCPPRHRTRTADTRVLSRHAFWHRGIFSQLVAWIGLSVLMKPINITQPLSYVPFKIHLFFNETELSTGTAFF